MKNLDAFLRLSHYLKSHQLYESFTEMDERNRRAISKIEANLTYKDNLSPEEEEELSSYREVLEKVEYNNKLLENSFNNYDFSEETLRQSLTDYKLYAFEFIVDTMMESLEKTSYQSQNQIINHVNGAERVIRKHFVEKFYLMDDLDVIFEKAVEKVLEKYLNWETETHKDEIESSQ
ncbi:MAG: hypothetical protein OEZ36_02010 [Spirochaetota bacterium]|nr:hypothetical protein [Spirochaetota bacterium]